MRHVNALLGAITATPPTQAGTSVSMWPDSATFEAAGFGGGVVIGNILRVVGVSGQITALRAPVTPAMVGKSLDLRLWAKGATSSPVAATSITPTATGWINAPIDPVAAPAGSEWMTSHRNDVAATGGWNASVATNTPHLKRISNNGSDAYNGYYAYWPFHGYPTDEGGNYLADLVLTY